MKISNKYPQFEENKSILIVTGKTKAVFYVAYNGLIEKVSSFEVEEEYIKNESFFVRSGKGKIYGTSSILEKDKNKLIDSFLKEFKSEFSKSVKGVNISDVYIYSPSHIEKRVQEVLPKTYSKKVVKVFKGNYVNKHPFDLLEKIKKIKFKDLKVKKQRPEAVEILKKVEKINKLNNTK